MKRKVFLLHFIGVLLLTSNSVGAEAPGSMESLIQWGRVAEREGEISKAQDFYARAIALDPGALAPLLARLELSEKYDSAADTLKKIDTALLTFPYDPSLYLMKTRLLRESSRLPEARQSWQNAQRLAPRTMPVLNEESLLLLSEGNLHSALAAAQKAVQMESSELSLKSLCRVFIALNLATEAREIAKKLMEMPETNASTWVSRQFKEPGYESLQEKALRQWIKRKPFLHEAHLLLGENLVRQERLAEAAQSFHEALSIDPSQTETLRIYLGFARDFEPAKAEKHLQQFTSMNPMHADGWKLHLNFLKDQDRLESLGKEGLALQQKFPGWTWLQAYLVYVDLRLKLTNTDDPRLQASSPLPEVSKTLLRLMAEGEALSPDELQGRLEELQSQGKISQAVAQENIKRIKSTPLPASERPLERTIRPGETLRLISLKQFGTKEKWTEIWNLNRDRLSHPGRIRIGQSLRMPTLATPRSPAQTQPTLWSRWIWDEGQL